MTAFLCESSHSQPEQAGGTSPFQWTATPTAARNFFPRTREPFCTDKPDGTVESDGNQPVHSKIGSVLVRSLVSGKPLAFFDLLSHHTKIENRSHTSRDGATPVESDNNNVIDIRSHRSRKHCQGIFQLPVAA